MGQIFKYFLLISILSVSELKAQGAFFNENEKMMVKVAQKSVVDFFAYSKRIVQFVKVESVNPISTSGANYLVEAEAKAQSFVNERYILYRCGIFIQRSGGKWNPQQTVCEALPEENF